MLGLATCPDLYRSENGRRGHSRTSRIYPQGDDGVEGIWEEGGGGIDGKGKGVKDSATKGDLK